MRAKTATSGTLEIHLDKQDGPLLASVKIEDAADWKIASATAKKIPKGMHDIVVTQTGGEAVNVDWVSFK